MSKFPLDVLTGTFYRLPVKTLLRFRALSKPLCSLIDDPDFIKHHLKHSLSTKSHLILILKGLHLYTVDLDSMDKATPFDDYPESIWGGTEVFGSCNGLVALSNSDLDIVLFNPATRKLFKLPVECIELPNESCVRGFVFFGFGYDHVKDDYKVVRMVRFKQGEDDDIGWFIDYEVKVFSLKTNSWRRIKKLPNYLRFMFQFYFHLMHRRGYGVYACGVLHWMLPRKPELGIVNLIVGFDLVAEEFRVLPQPDYGENEKDFVLDVGVLEGLLCVICNYDQVKVDVWMMKEYGVKESWSKLFSVGRNRSISSVRFLKPLAYSKECGDGDGSDKILLDVNGEKLVWYDWKRKRLKTVRIKGAPDSFGTFLCVESLVPLVDEKKKKQQKQEKERNHIRKKRDDFLSKGFKLVL
ncbi:F-box protein CPR1-like [Mangifera indica]|uniref:F-box protein CPR1-like n=1 Tax=Mangifera indica TaxID=29780 RepID=UPI001CFA9604|nr:F-box protein CPR1-like [Mangifera indica]XP_044461901.1 F-box protein CPR1-like [Mangifera indica]